jgi:DNA modification methylase
MAKIDITKTELIWPGKYNEDGSLREVPRVSLPFQVIETVNESRATREAHKSESLSLFDTWTGNEADTFEGGWHNKLIWGDNLLVMGSLLEKFAGKVDLIYIDPPFDTGADFSFKVLVGQDDEPLRGKEPSLVEESAYRDTWGRGYDSYLSMMNNRLRCMRDLLSEHGAIFVHLDVHTGPYVKTLMDEVFGRDCFRNEIAWYYYNKMHDSRKKLLPKAFDQILYYVKSKDADFTYNALQEERDEPVRQLKRVKVGGKMINARDEDGNIIYQEKTTRTVDTVWRIRCLQPANKQEWVHYETQKPVDLIERVLQVASKPGDLVLDAFVGSGTTAIACERTGRRWIACDLGRFSIHTTRKRLLEEEDCNPFEILNLGKYERQYWQSVTFGEQNNKLLAEQALYDYLAFILKLYGAQPVAGMAHLHGKKSKAMVHIGAVDAPVTIAEIDAAVDECAKLKQGELHVLGWEWEMGLYDLMVEAAKKKGVKLLLLQIPREMMEQQAAAKGDVRFFELAYLEAEIKQPKKLTVQVKLSDFVIPNTDLIPEDIRSKVKKWSDYIDYWSVDWDFRNDTFMQGWVAYRTRKERKLTLTSDAHTYGKPGKYRVLVNGLLPMPSKRCLARSRPRTSRPRASARCWGASSR